MAKYYNINSVYCPISEERVDELLKMSGEKLINTFKDMWYPELKPYLQTLSTLHDYAVDAVQFSDYRKMESEVRELGGTIKWNSETKKKIKELQDTLISYRRVYEILLRRQHEMWDTCKHDWQTVEDVCGVYYKCPNCGITTNTPERYEH